MKVKICGLTRHEDVKAAVQAGADALGFVFSEKSTRFIAPTAAAELVARVPPFVTSVGLFVNASEAFIRQILAQVPLSCLQFHGDTEIETNEFCKQFGLPFIKAFGAHPDVDWVKRVESYQDAQGLLLDTPSEQYGGTGTTFDWTLIPSNLRLPIILSGGLTAQNVVSAIQQVKPWAVDVSSGVEAGIKGIKDSQKIHAFMQAVQSAK
jgi:phosphoribosylanthranilate isomerase